MDTPKDHSDLVHIDESKIDQNDVKNAILSFCNGKAGLPPPSPKDLTDIRLFLELGFTDKTKRTASGLLPKTGLAWAAVFEDDNRDAPLLLLDADRVSPEELQALGLNPFLGTLRERSESCSGIMDDWVRDYGTNPAKAHGVNAINRIAAR